jgi:hypothetical protein
MKRREPEGNQDVGALALTVGRQRATGPQQRLLGERRYAARRTC